MYDQFEDSWKPVSDTLMVEFTGDGRYTSAVQGRLTSGTYSIDQVATPHRLVLNDDKAGRINIIFKLEGNKLTLKANKTDAESSFPSDLNTGVDGDFELSVLERN